MARSQKASRAGSSRSGALVRRTLGYAAFLPLAGRAPMYARLIVALIQDRRMPKARTALPPARPDTWSSAATSSRTTSR
jgi:hypothetical protein